MYESQILEIKNQEAKIYELAAQPESSFAPIFAFSGEENKSSEQIKAEKIKAEKEYLNLLLRNLGELVAFGPTNNLAI
jgi:hypothetical protein